MKRLLFFVLMVGCSVSWAEWEYTGENIKYTNYVDRSTIRISGAVVTMWELSDYFEVQTTSDGKRFKSNKVRVAFNCVEDAYAIISLVLYSGSMGEGSIIKSHELKESQWNWKSVVPGSSSENSWSIACGKK